MSKDIGNYSDTICFETEVYPGVFWVPLNTLGKTRYTNEQMHEIVQMPIEYKKASISNLYEAVQLFQLSEFRGVIDNIKHWIGDVQWDLHKKPEQAILSNEGCCATDTNWLAYFIKDHYDFVGSFCYANADGNGHITTYIQQDGDYYFLDMMMCRKDSQDYFCKETGILSDLLDSEWTGFLYRCKNPVDFCKFNISRFEAKKRMVPFCFYVRETEYVLATGVHITEKGTTFLVPKLEKPNVVCCESGSNQLLMVDLPEQVAKTLQS